MGHTRETRAAASEIKFVVDPTVASRIREWARAHLVRDPYGLGAFGDEYETTSLYFDTATFDVFHRRGSYGRAKYRVRRYNHGDVAFLERKLRKPRMLVKRRTMVPIEAVDMLEPSAIDAEWSGDWFRRRLVVRQLHPVCQVSYQRMARVLLSDDGVARLTLDSRLRATAVDNPQFVDRAGLEYLPDALILELKYRSYLPALFRRLVEQFALAAMPVSKYRLAVAALGTVTEPVRADRQPRTGGGHAAITEAQ